MRVLVTWGSKRGGTEGIAQLVGDALREAGFDVDLRPPREAAEASGFEAAIIGGALYANRWHAKARRFVRLRQKDLTKVPVWFFSSGPLNASAAREAIPPTKQVEILMERVGAQGHVTFGGRLAADANSALAKKRSGDWRDSKVIRAWAADVAKALPTARPRPLVPQAGASWTTLLLHAALGWALCGALLAGLLWRLPLGVALVLHAVAVPFLYIPVSVHYFRRRGARDALPTALAFTATAAGLDLLVVAALIQRSLAMFASPLGVWLPWCLLFLTTLAVGEVMSMMPSNKPGSAARVPKPLPAREGKAST